MKSIAPQPVAYPPPQASATRRRPVRAFRKRMLLMACAATLLIVGLAAIIYINAAQYRGLSRDLRHAYLVERQLADVRAAAALAESLHLGYLLSADEKQLASYYADASQLQAGTDTLAAMLAGDPAQLARVRDLRQLLARHTQQREAQLRAYRQGGLAAAASALATQPRLPSVLALTRSIRAAEQAQTSDIVHRRRRLGSLTVWLTGVCLLACLALLWRAVVLAMREQAIRVQSEHQIADANADLAALLEQSQRLADQLTRLADLGEMLQSCRKLSEALAVIAASMPELLPASAGAIQLLNHSRNLVETACEWGTPPLAYEGVYASDDCLALRRGHAYPTTGAHAAVHCQHLHATPVEAAATPHLCVPLVNQGDTLGVFHVQPERPIGQDMRRLLLTIGEHLALALGNLRMQETLRMQSIRDPLTGLFNRRYLEATLTRELLRAQRSGQPLAVLMLDIDHFKRFNDTYGHEAGDTLLVQLATTLRRTIRAEEIACRFGGEEFTVILPEISTETALRRAEDIRVAIAAIDVRHHEEALGQVTCSLGVAGFPVNGIDAGQLLRAADAALYQAKREGRNRSVLAGAG